MTDKEVRAERKRTKDILTKWRGILGLHTDRFHYEFHRLPHPDNSAVTAEVKASWQYRNHYVDVYLSQTSRLDDSELEECLVHELCHVLLSPLWDSQEDKTVAEIEKNEYTTTSLAYAILWAYQAGKAEK